MTHTPTIEAFLAQAGTDDDDDEDQVELDPLTSIAASLSRLVSMAEDHGAEEKASDDLRESLDDLDAKHEVLFDLVEEIRAIVKPSTSKLANTVRDAIARWSSPVAPAAEPPVKVPAEPVPAANAAEMGHLPPVNDASAEEWREYARSLGHEVTDQVNRSQVRTMLGLPHAT